MKKLMILNVIILLASSLLNATIIHIPADFSTIQGGIDASVDGDTVLIAQGIYYENLILEKEIVLASHAIYDDLDSDWLNNENITGTIISGAQEPSDPNMGSCLVIRGGGYAYSGNPEPEIIGLTFQDGDGTTLIKDNCGVPLTERSGGAILMYKAYPTIMYNRFINNGHDTDNSRASGGGRKGGAMGHYSDDGIEFDEDRNSSSWNNNRNSKTIGEYIFGNPDDVAAYNNGMNPQKIHESKQPKDLSSFNKQEKMLTASRDLDFVPGDGVRGDLNIYMYDAYGDGWNGCILSIGGNSFTIPNGNYGEATLTLDDGSYPVICGGGDWESEVSWEIVDAADGTLLLSGGAPYDGALVIGGNPAPDILVVRNNYFENNASGDGENFYSNGFEGLIDVSFSIFEDIDCETGKVNDFVLRSIEDEAGYIQNEISGDCIESSTFYVSPGNGDDNSEVTESDPFKTIGQALTLAKGHGTITTINISGGVYSPSTNGERFPIVLPDNVHLIGASMQWTRLDAQADENAEAAVIIIKEVEDVRVANMTLTGGYSEGHGCTGGGGLLITADDMFNADAFDSRWTYATIENVIIEDNHSHNGGGLSLYRSKGSILNNVTIKNNTASAFGGGVFTYGSTVDMTNVTVTENSNNIGGTAQGGGMMMPVTGGTLDNMTITNNEGCCGGAGIWTNGNNCTWTMTNSIIDGNTSDWGAGLAVLGGDVTGAVPTLINVTISNNTASSNGGAVWTVGAGPTFENCTITGNTAYGDGMGGTFWLMGADVTGEDITLTDCLINENSVPYATAGIWAMDVSGVNLTRVTIANNSGGWNPGVFISDAFDNGDYTPATLTNCTITGNQSYNGGAVRATYGGHVSIINSVIYGNYTPYQISLDQGTAAITYTNIQYGWRGSGNIIANPLFTDPGNGDYTLTSSSPCIDAGTADLNGDGMEDIDYVGDAPDMGAFEFGGILGCTDPEAENFDPDANMDDGSCEYLSTSEISVSYNTGWNMVGLPLEVEDAHYQTLFPDAYNNAMYSFDGSYSPVEYLIQGEGYLVRLSDGGIVEFSGATIDELTLSLTEGWNLISGISTSLPVDVLYNSGLVVSNGIYAFDGSYYQASAIDPGMGYWVRALADGDVTLSSSSSMGRTVPIVNHFSDANTLKLSNGTHSSTLYFGKDVAEEHRNSYSLPPTFPQMAFDARFTDNMRYAKDLGEISVINTNKDLTLNYTVNIHPGDYMEWVLITDSGEEYILTGTDEIVLNQGTTVMTLTKRAILPQEYTLHQNYPNPFNPVTSLSYNLPEQAQVTLIVYDLMGRKITQLINTIQEAGYKSVQWNATDTFGKPVSAGVYLYQIQAGEFVQTRKMVLLK